MTHNSIFPILAPSKSKFLFIIGSRKKALRKFRGEEVEKELLAKGITVKATHPSVLAEEASPVYKQSDEVVDVVHQVGVACRVAQVVPIGVAKG